MPAPYGPTYSGAAIAAAHTAFCSLLDAGGGGTIQIKDHDDVVLAEVPLAVPCGTVDGMTGRLTIVPAGRDEAAAATGVATYADFCDSAGTTHLSLPADVGYTPFGGCIMLSTSDVMAGGPVEVISVTIG